MPVLTYYVFKSKDIPESSIEGVVDILDVEKLDTFLVDKDVSLGTSYIRSETEMFDNYEQLLNVFKKVVDKFGDNFTFTVKGIMELDETVDNFFGFCLEYDKYKLISRRTDVFPCNDPIVDWDGDTKDYVLFATLPDYYSNKPVSLKAYSSVENVKSRVSQFKYTERTGNLVRRLKNSCIAHCITADFSLGAGLAKVLNDKFDLSDRLDEQFHNIKSTSDALGKALYIEARDTKIFNLVDKQDRYDFADYIYIEQALIDMKNQCKALGITSVIMPRIGCGRDKLDWTVVSAIIKEIFEDTDMKITVYSFD